MKSAHLILLSFALILPLAAASHQAGVEGKKSKKQEAADAEGFLSSVGVVALKIELTATNLGTLEKEPRGYVRATVREGETVYAEVALHLKGGTGSFRPLAEKPAFTLNFDKFKDGQKFHGLDKIHLNNSAQDETFMTHAICGELFRNAGVPAARTTYARVELNGRDLGLYVLSEGIEKTFLRRYFKNPNGNLYESGTQQDITQELERTSGNESKDQSDLKALASAANEPDPSKRWSRIESLLDIDRFLSFMAIETMTWHADGYSMRKNNYRVYHDPATGKMVFFPDGMDQMFGEPNGPVQPEFSGLVSRALMQTAEGRREFRARMAKLLTTVFKPDAIDAHVKKFADAIRPVLAQSEPPAAKKFDAAVAQLREKIAQRARFLEQEIKKPAAEK